MTEDATEQKATIQLTSKRLKLHSLLSSLTTFVGIGMTFVNLGSDQPPGVWPWVILVGLVWYLVTKARIWWHHD